MTPDIQPISIPTPRDRRKGTSLLLPLARRATEPKALLVQGRLNNSLANCDGCYLQRLAEDLRTMRMSKPSKERTVAEQTTTQVGLRRRAAFSKAWLLKAYPTHRRQTNTDGTSDETFPMMVDFTCSCRPKRTRKRPANVG